MQSPTGTITPVSAERRRRRLARSQVPVFIGHGAFHQTLVEIANHFHYRLAIVLDRFARLFFATRRHALAAAFGGAFGLASSGVARATPHPLPFSYPHVTLPAGHLELEQYVDVVPSRAERELAGGTESVPTLRFEMQSEIELGITDSLELGWYFAYQQAASADEPGLTLDGIKQRLRYRFADAGEWPVNVGAYVEVAELYDEIELEEKVLLSKQLGPVTVVTNLWVEQEYKLAEKRWEYLYNPTLGASFEASPRVSPGIEYWVHGNFESEEAGEEEGAHHYLGPTLLLQTGEYFLSLGAYARLDDFGKAAVAGDPWGKFWFRAIVGIGL